MRRCSGVDGVGSPRCEVASRSRKPPRSGKLAEQAAQRAPRPSRSTLAARQEAQRTSDSQVSPRAPPDGGWTTGRDPDASGASFTPRTVSLDVEVQVQDAAGREVDVQDRRAGLLEA